MRVKGIQGAGHKQDKQKTTSNVVYENTQMIKDDVLDKKEYHEEDSNVACGVCRTCEIELTEKTGPLKFCCLNRNVRILSILYLMNIPDSVKDR